MPPYYKPVSKEEFHERYRMLSDPFAILFSTQLRGDEDPKEYFQDKNIFFLNEENGKSLLHEAAIKENVQFINFLNDAGHDLNLLDKEYKTPLYDACSELKLASVDALLNYGDYGADPNLGNSHLILQGNRYDDGTEALVNYQGETIPLVVTIDSINPMALKQFESTLNQPNTDDFYNVAIGSSAEHTAASIIEKLIQKGANVNLQTGPDHFSALHRAITYKYISLIKVIINSGQANPYLIDRDGETALHIVANYRHRIEKNFELAQMQQEKEIAELIIPYLDTLVMHEIKFGNTPLHAAVIRSNELVVKLLYQRDYLFQHRKILSLQNNAGNTAVHEAVNAARRGPKILELLLRVATPDELAITNYAGKTAKDIAEELLQESSNVDWLIQELKNSEKNLDVLMDSFQHRTTALHNLDDGTIEKTFEWKPTHNQVIELKQAIIDLNSAIEKLESNVFFNAVITDIYELTDDIKRLSSNLKNYEQIASLKKGDYYSNLVSTADKFHSQALKLVDDIDDNFLDKSYLKSLTSVRQQEYFSWKNKVLKLPSSFPDLVTLDINSAADQIDKIQADLYLSSIQGQLMNTNYSEAKKAIEAAIETYHRLNAYGALEKAYQLLARITISQGQHAITHYEETNRNKVFSSDHWEKLQGHLALAQLYNEVLERKLTSSSFLPEFNNVNELLARESYYFYNVYKLTEGALDNTAHVVLQRELGIAHNAKLGTYNIQQCIAVVAFDPDSKKVVLSHFDKFSGPLSFIDQLLNEFPDHSKIDLYLSGARDRISLASPTRTISDNNIEQVLKQIYAEKDRFVIRSSDIGDKPSPEAIVFDSVSRRLVHAVPHFPDHSLASREVNFQLQWVKGDYLRPLNRVDFTQNEASRKISFSIEQREQIYQLYLNFQKIPDQTDAWNHQAFYPLMTLSNEMLEIRNEDYSVALFTDLNRLNAAHSVDQQNSQLLMDIGDEVHHDLEHLPFSCLEKRRKRDLHCVLDSQSILDYLESLSDSQQAETLNYLASKTVGGAKEEEVSRLIYNEKIKIHLGKVSLFSSHLMNALFLKDAISGLFKNGDPTAAINLVAIIGSNHLLVQTSKRIAEKGTRLLATGRIVPGKLLRASSPFIARGTSLLFAYDLYTQIKAIEKNNQDTEAWVNAVSDGIFLSMDALEIGIEVAEFSSEAFALLEISSITNPVTAIIGGIIILGIQIYESVKKVAHENELVRLTAWEKFKEGWRAFLPLDPEDSVKKMMDEAIEYNQLLKEKHEFLKNLPEIKFFIFPALKQVGETCRKVSVPCDGSFHYMTVLVSKNCPTETVCTPKFNTTLDNWIYFKRARASEVKLTREVINPPSGTQLLCLPTTEEGIPPPPEIVYRCDDALGLNITDNTLGKTALYDLGEGKDHVYAFDAIPNIFIVNNGEKRYVGGYKDDVYIVKASKVVSAFNPPNRFVPLNHLKGGLDGEGGIDTLNLKGFKPTTEKITIDLNKGFLNYNNSSETLGIKHIENLICGKFPLSVIVGCDTQKVDITGGSTFEKADTILIPKNSACYYATNFYLTPHSRLNNQAMQGHFTYTIQPGMGIISVNVTTENTDEKLSFQRALSQHQFVFNADISDLFALSSTERSITFHFSVNKVNRIYRALQTISIVKNNAANAITLDYQFKPDSFLDKDHLALLPKYIESNSQKKLMALFKNVAVNNTIRVNDRAKIHEILFHIVENSGFTANDFKVELNFSFSNNFFFHFIDGTEIKIAKGVNYLFHKGGQNIDDIIAFYSPIAHRLTMVCNINTLLNQRILIGHYGHQVMHNDHYAYETHIVSNGGQVLLVIQPLLPPVASTLNEVILHHTPLSRNVDTLDFRQIKAKIQTELGIRARAIQLVILSRHNAHSFLLISSKENKKLENDLLLILGIKLYGNIFTDFIAVRLKDALLSTWYRDHLQVILNVAPQKITGNVTHLSLQPIPLRLDATHEFISIGIQDVEENTEIILSRESYHDQFYHHNKTNLICTNTLSTSDFIKPFSIILKNFYNEPKLATLSFKFSNKEVILKEKLTELNAVEDFEDAMKKQEERLKKESRTLLSSTSIQQAESNKKEGEPNPQNLTRPRRSILKPLHTALIDSAQERADAYYDRYDRIKEKPRLKKASAKTKSIKNLTTDSTPLQFEGHKTSALIKKIKTPQLKKLMPDPYKTDLPFIKPSKTLKAPKASPLSSKQPFVSKKRFYPNDRIVKKSQTPLNPPIGTATFYKAKVAQPTHYLPEENAKAKLTSRYASHHSFKSGGLTRVTASCDLQSSLFVLNFVAKCFNKKNTRSSMPPKIQRIQEKTYKQHAKAQGMINI